MTTEYIDIVIRERGAKKTSDAIGGVGNSARGVLKPLQLLKNLLASIGLIQIARGVNRLVGEFASLERRVSQFASAGRSANDILRDMQRQANLTDSSIVGTVEGYARLRVATRELGFSHSRVLNVLDQTQKLIQLSGATTMEATGGMQQFSQALASGRLSGDEFRSIMENIPTLMRAIAEGMDTPIGKLKEMGAQGKLTPDVIINAIEKMSTKTDAQFKSLVRTPAQAFTRLRNNAVMTFGQIAKSSGILSGATSALDFFADNVVAASGALLGLGINMALIAGGGAAASLGKSLRLVGVAARFMWASLLGPVGLVIGGIFLLVGMLKRFSGATITAGEDSATLGQVWAGVTQGMGEAWDKFTSFSASSYQKFISGPFGEATKFGLSLFRTAINKKIGLVVGATRIMSEAWELFSDDPGTFMKVATNQVLQITRNMIQRTLNFLQAPLRLIEKLAEMRGKKLDLTFELPELKLFDDKETIAQTDRFKQIWKEALDVDYIGAGFEKFKEFLVDIAIKGSEAKEATTLDPIPPKVLTSFETLKKLVEGFAKVGEPFGLAEQGVQELNTQLENGVLDAYAYQTSIARLEDAFLAAGGTAQQFGKILEQNALRSQAEILIETLDRMTKPLDDITTAKDRLNVAYRDGLIAGGEYIAMLNQLDQAYLQAGGGQGTFATGFMAQIATMRKGVLDLKRDAGTAFGQMFTSFSEGAADAFGRAIVYGESLGSALQNVARQALAELIGSLIKMGLQLAINAVLGKTLAASSTAASIASASALSAAWATPAALASLATVGTNAAPASAALLGTVALSKGLTAAASFFEKGGAFSGGVEMFANGGVFNSPTAFQFSKGGAPSLGVMGEAGPEAILPLKRGKDGRLGVSAGAEGRGSVALNVKVENHAPGVEHEVQQISATEFKVIAREQAKQVVKDDAPRLVAAEIDNPSSRVSTALSRNTTAQRRR